MDSHDRQLQVLVEQGCRLSEEYRFRSWEPQEKHVAAALRFLLRRQQEKPSLGLVAIIGPSSAGKSTIFNNLIGKKHISHVRIEAHTTEGCVLAVPYEFEKHLRMLLDMRILFPSHEHEDVEPDQPQKGKKDHVMVVPVKESGAGETLLIDTPDYSTERSRVEGDETWGLLPWFDSVLIVVNPEHFFDRKTTNELREALDRFGVRRRIVFNCNEVDREINDASRKQLDEEAALLKATHDFIEYRAGRGFLRFPSELLDGTREWLALANGQVPRRISRLGQIVRGMAQQVLNENDARIHQLQKLRRNLEHLVDDFKISKDSIAGLMLSPEERNWLRMQWIVVGRDKQEANRWRWSLVTRVKAFWGGRHESQRVHKVEEFNPQDNGKNFFKAKLLERISWVRKEVYASRFWTEIGKPDKLKERIDSIAIPPSDSDLERMTKNWPNVVRDCRSAVEAIPGLRHKFKNAGIGSAVGCTMFAIFLLSTGGASLAVSAFTLPAVVSGILTWAGLTSTDAYKLRRSKEFFALGDAIDTFRDELLKRSKDSMLKICELLNDHVLRTDTELYSALKFAIEHDIAKTPADQTPAFTGEAP